MKKNHSRYAGLVLLLALAAIPPLAADEKAPVGAPQMTPEDLDRMNRAMTPAEPHLWLAQLAGEWTYTSTSWMTPGAAPLKSTGTTTKTMILGGRYLEEIHRGDHMGQPFEGRMVIGFDNTARQYNATWIDNFGTGLMTFTGPPVSGKQMVLRTDTVNPMTGVAEEVRTITRLVDVDHHVFEYYAKPAGQPETKVMEITLSRQKS